VPDKFRPYPQHPKAFPPENIALYFWRSIVPNISVFENSRVPINEEEDIDNNFTIAPDWTIEILSPGQRTAKVIKNINHCLAHISQMGWLIDPEDKLVMVVGIGQKIDVFDDLSVTLPVPKFAEHIKLTGSDIFSWTKKRKIITPS
jgi:Uma2 family endonuclease